MQALILAAGIGNRFPNLDKPKGFIELGKKPIVVESIEKLSAIGVNDIIIIIGYKKEYYLGMSEYFDNININFVVNEDYETTGTLKSFNCAKELIKDEVIILDSDIIYHKEILKKVYTQPSNNLAIANVNDFGDEVYVNIKNKKIYSSKNKKELLTVDGMMVGIAKLNKKSYDDIVNNSFYILEQNPIAEQDIDGYAMIEINGCYVDDMLFCEIDNEEQYKIAKSIYAKLEV